jgi:hypothetical protein
VITSQQIREWAAAGVLAGALGVCGCGSGEDKTTHTAAAASTHTTPPAPAPAVVAVPTGLRGSWRRTMHTADWGPGGNGYPVGRWRVDIDRHGAVSVYLPRTDAVDFTTGFAAKGRRLTIASIPVCPGQTGRYTWRASAGALRLTRVADACKARAALFGGTWTRRAAGR